MLENVFKTKLIHELEDLFPGCLVLHLDPTDIQGIPDLLILYKNKWAALEVKKSLNASHRPNQDYYVSLLDDMSYCAFICPENSRRILDELQRSFKA